MKRFASITACCALVIAGSLAVGAWGKGQGKGPQKARGHSLTVIEHPTTDVTTDTGAAGDSAGDLLTFANEVFDAKDSAKVATDNGYCVRTVAGQAYECNWTTSLPKGQITVEGPFYDTKDSTLAITGGTGSYRHVRGTMDLKSMGDGKFAFVFHLNS
jgi:Allene oxide cyclase barrel like domain